MGSKGHEISIKKLKEQLGATASSYDQFKFFRAKVLDVAVAEINEISDISVSYKKRTVGHRIVSIIFDVKIKRSEPVIDAESSEIETTPLRDVSDNEKPVKSPRNGAYEDVDWASLMPGVDEKQCASIARSVARRIKSEYPNIRKDKKKDAVVNIVQGAYEQAVKDKPDVEVPEAYLRTVIKDSQLSKFATFGFDYLE